MSSRLSREAVERAGFGSLWEAIDDLTGATPAQAEALRAAPLLVLGALANRARELWVGERVRVLPPAVAEREPAPTLGLAQGDTGLHFLRDVACLRLTTPASEHVRVDWASAGMEMVQASLLFGADEVVGAIATKAGLPLVERAARALRKADVAGLIKRAGRLPVFVSETGNETTVNVPDALPAAHRADSMIGLTGEDVG